MTITAHRRIIVTAFTPADRVVLTVDHHAEQARRSATVTTWAAYRARMHRRNAQVAFSRAWGLS